VSLFSELNIKTQCNRLKVGLWECPHFLFILMGILIIAAMISTSLLANQYADPELAALVVIAVTGMLVAISHIVIRSVERTAEASQARTEFISIVSHQLRNPLSSIRWQIEVLMRDDTLNKKTRSYLEGINEYNNRMAKLVNDLLTVNRIESDRLVLSPAMFSLTDTTQHILKDNALFASASHITFTVEAPKDIPPVYADELHVRWAMENLVSNAIRYSEPRTAIIISIVKKSPHLRWSIANHGKPIPESDARHIFKKFFRTASTAKNHTEGFGLGLFIAKSVVQASGGEIGFTSNKSGDTTFWFTLPYVKKSRLKKSL
jgi:signal transduction histidine kinase